MRREAGDTSVSAVPQTANPVFNGSADFGFNFQCDDGVKGQITYHDTQHEVLASAASCSRTSGFTAP